MAFYSLELTLSYSNLRVSPDSRGVRISIHLQIDGTTQFLEISQTETIFDRPSGTFKQTTSVPYHFDSTQFIRFTVLRVQNEEEHLSGSEGHTQLSLAALVCSPLPTRLQLPTGTEITACVRPPPSCCDYVRLSFRAHFLKSFNNFPLASYFLLLLVSEERTVLLYKSEVSRSKDAVWAPFRVAMLPGREANLQLRVFNDNVNGEDSLIGYMATSLTQLLKGAGHLNTYMLMYSAGVRRSEKLSVELSSIETNTGPSFFDMMKTGCELHAAVAIDLTASNGNPLEPTSLHYIHPHERSAYSLTLERVLSPIAHHMRIARFSALGFGAKLPHQHAISNCFPLIPTSEHVAGVAGVLGAYRQALLSVQPFGPTQFADVIYHVSKFAKAARNLSMNAFFVLYILTDGAPSLCRRSVDSLVDLSAHPIVVFFVAVGKNEKEHAALRKAQSHPLKHSDGRVASRQVAVFVSSEEGDDALGLLPPLMAQWKNYQEMAAS